MSNFNNQNICQMLLKAGPVVEAMTQNGLTIQNVIIRAGKVTVNVVKNPICEQWLNEGKAGYTYINSSSEGWRGRHGVYEINDCRVVWAESLH